MTKRYEYLTFLFNDIFTHGLAQFDIESDGYVEFDEDILAYLPIDSEVNKIMHHYMMQNVNGVLIFGGPKTKKNWWYTYFDTDDISQVFNSGNFNFEMSIQGEKDSIDSSFRTQVEVKNFIIDTMFIDSEDKDIYLIKDGKFIK